MKLLKRFKNLFTPQENDKPSPKTAKKTKKKIKKKIKTKPKLKKNKKKVIKRKVIKKKTKKKVIKRKKKVKKKSVKPLKRLLEEKEIGIVTHYFGKISVGIIKLKSTLRAGEKIHIKGAHDDFTQTVKSMQINHKDVSMAGKGSEIGIKASHPVHENDRVYKI